MSRRHQLVMPSTEGIEPDERGEELKASTGTPQPPAVRSAGVVSAITGAGVSTPLSVAQLPTPYDVAETVNAPLDDREREHLAVCEQALTGFRKSVIVAGKALEVINRGRLYREAHSTFVEYLDDVWEIRKSQAYRMIEAWPVAAAVSPIGDINEGQARQLQPVFKDYGHEAALAVYREVKALRGDRKVTAADLAEARAILPPPRQLARPEQVREVIALAAAEGRAPRLATPVARHPEPAAEKNHHSSEEGGVTSEQVNAGAEAIAIMERAVAQQRQIYDAVPPDVREAALLYDPARGELLRSELRQYATRTAYRMRNKDTTGEAET